MGMVGFRTLLIREVKRFFRIPTQTIGAPVLSALLFLLIFGSVIGGRVGEISGISYIEFIVPGLVMMNLVTSSMSNGNFSIFIQKFLNIIDDLLISPLSYYEIVLAFMFASMIRGLIIGSVVFLISIFFIGFQLFNPLALLFFMIVTSSFFSSLGLLIGLYSEKFEQLEVLNVFLITPLIFLGGIFYSVRMLPEAFQLLTHLNPFFYIANGFRYSMLGVTEANLLVGGLIITIATIIFFSAIVYLFKIGYKLRT
jgi:ABC-2 type transport system permease protein